MYGAAFALLAMIKSEVGPPDQLSCAYSLLELRNSARPTQLKPSTGKLSLRPYGRKHLLCHICYFH